jgi:hypothetical protein
LVLITEIEANFKITIETRITEFEADLVIKIDLYIKRIKLKYEESVTEWDEWLKV